MISQDLFDETLIESQELFNYEDNEQAVRETISELQSQNKDSRLDHLSLTHPDSELGRKERESRKEFVQALELEDLSRAMAIVINGNVAAKNINSMAIFASLVLQHGFCQLRSNLMQRLDLVDSDKVSDEHELEADEMVQFLLTILDESRYRGVSSQHPLIRELKLQLGRTFLQERWFPLYDTYTLLRVSLINLARVLCNGCEANKKTLVQAGIRFKTKRHNETDLPRIEAAPEDVESLTATAIETTEISGIQLLMEGLPQDLSSNGNELMARELCQLLSILGKFQAGAEPIPSSENQAPVVSSAHANVKEFFKCRAVPRLHQLAQQCLETHSTMSKRKVAEREALLCQVLSALRVLAIDNEIVQQMVAVGVLDTLDTTGVSMSEGDRTLLVHEADTAAATLGLFRNLCANDEIKTTLCRQSLAPILQAMELHHRHGSVQEHGCGILAAMSLRNPPNASKICDATRGGEPIVKAMKSFPTKVTLQRQACLALRNIASRATMEEKQKILDAGTEFVLREIAGRHQDSVDEAYAALRDLGCATVKYTIDETGRAQGTQMFGDVQSNFRATYD